jgi:hypothetical protein
MSRHVRGHGIEQLLERLAATERAIPFLAEQPEARVHFRRVGHWLVEERFLLALLAARARGQPHPAPPRLAKMGALRMLAALGLSRRYVARCRAQAIYFKKHVRAFFLTPRACSLKLVVPAAREGISRELAARSRVEGRVLAPRLLAHRLEGPHPHLCEELVFGRRPNRKRDEQLVLRFVLDELWESYRSAGFEWRPCTEFHQLDALLKSFEATLDDWTRWPSTWPAKCDLREPLTRLADEAEKLVPCCLGHGDLSDGNMLVADDRILLFDWEHAGRLPILLDLAKIVVQYPASWKPILARTEQEFAHAPNPGMVSARNQSALAALDRIAKLHALSSPGPDFSTWQARRTKSRYRGRVATELQHLARVLYEEPR